MNAGHNGHGYCVWSAGLLLKFEQMRKHEEKTTTTHHLFSKSLSHTNTCTPTKSIHTLTQVHMYVSNCLCGRSNAWLSSEQVGNEKKTKRKRKKRNCKDNFCCGCALLLLLPQWSAADVLDAPRRDMRLTAAPSPKEKEEKACQLESQKGKERNNEMMRRCCILLHFSSPSYPLLSAHPLSFSSVHIRTQRQSQKRDNFAFLTITKLIYLNAARSTLRCASYETGTHIHICTYICI